MVFEEMVDRATDMLGCERMDDLVPCYLELAMDAVVGRLYPYDPDASWSDVPSRFHGRTCEIAVYLLNRIGSEGESKHVEGGVERTYASSLVPPSYFEGMVPMAGVPR